MYIAETYTDAKKLYDLSVDLANNWISRFYPDNNLEYHGVRLEEVQAFSQHYFFSCLFEKGKINNIWTQYPEILEKSVRNSNFFKRILARIFDFSFKNLTAFQNVSIRNEKFDIIFLASGRHLDDLLPLVIHLKKYFKVCVVGKIKKNTQTALADEKIVFLDIDNTRRFASFLARLKHLYLINKKPWILRKRNGLFKMPSWKSRLWYLRLQLFPEILALLDLACELFVATNPKVLLTTTSNDTFGAAFCLAAQACEIKVAEIQHGLTSWEIIESNFYNSDYYLVWGKLAKKYHPKNVQIVGCPYAWEELKIEKSNLNRNLDNKSILVLWTPPFGSLSLFKSRLNYKVLEDLTLGLAKLPKSMTISLRSHPSYPIEDSNIKKLPFNIVIDQEKDFLQSVKRHNIIVAGGVTTAALAAIFYKKPLLFFDSNVLFEKFGEPFTNSKSAVNVSLGSLRKIDRYILNLLNDKQLLERQRKAQDKFVNDYCAKFGKDSWIAIEKFIEQIISRNNHPWKKT